LRVAWAWIWRTDAGERNVEGVVEMMLDATQKYARASNVRAPVWLARCDVSDRRSGMVKNHGGRLGGKDQYRSMQVVSARSVVSGFITKAPRARTLIGKMRRFWNGLIKINYRSGFEGGRSAFVVRNDSSIRRRKRSHRPRDSDMALARSENSTQRFLQHVRAIRKERKAYYDILEATQKGDTDITAGWNGSSDAWTVLFDRAETTLAT